MTAEAYGRGDDSLAFACASLATECGEFNWYEPDEGLLDL
jgi:hypothetical protein